jgi:peptidoglycan/LPS O-acetylase OafA/YrhL
LKVTRNQSVFLDVSRGIAAQLVLVEHLLTSLGYKEVFVGSFGVVVFFLLSGFLIAMSVDRDIESNRFTLWKYIVGRFSRIFTLYIPVLMFVILLDLVSIFYGGSMLDKVDHNLTFGNLVGSIFMLQQNPISEIGSQIFGLDWLAIKPFGSARPIWTVAIEWWIYVFFGFLVAYFLGERRTNPLALFVFLFSALVAGFNLVTGIGHNLTMIWFLGVFGFQLYRSETFLTFCRRISTANAVAL